MDAETEELGNIEFPCGKYGPSSGDACPIWYVADEDPQYCDWFIGNTDPDTFRASLEKYMKVKYPHGY